VGTPEEVGKFLVGSGKRDPDRPGDREFEIVEVAAGTRTDVRVLDPEITDRDATLAGELAVDETTDREPRPDDPGDRRRPRVDPDLRQHATDRGGARLAVQDARGAGGEGRGNRRPHRDRGPPRLALEGRADRRRGQVQSGDLDGLVCTSSMELGIDVGRVDHVVQYGSPREVARLLQRVGRAGHRRDLVSEGTVVTQGGDDTLEALAIARRADAELVEPAAIHHGSLDTVANQIVGVVMDEGDVHARVAYDVITSAYPFRDLSEPQFQEDRPGAGRESAAVARRGVGHLGEVGGTWQYFYANLSMIPDESTYEVYDMSSRRGSAP